MSEDTDVPEPASFADLLRLDLRVATVTACRPNPKARQPAYVLELDLGELGTRTSSAQLTERYGAEDLVGRQVVCACGLPPKRVAGVKSEALVMGALAEQVILLAVEAAVPPGTQIA